MWSEFLGTIPERHRAALAAALEGTPPVSVRMNPFKITVPPLGRQVPWCRWGRYLGERPLFALDPLWHAGAYYVQEASSMFVGWMVEQITGEGGSGIEGSGSQGGSREGLRMLDMCAAPGGKATLLAIVAGLEGLVVANEPIRARAQTLSDNVARWGLGNVVVTSNDPSHFGATAGFFDVVLVDAPCSGEGMFRRHPEARGQWSPAAVELCARRQRRILADAWASVAPGGHLVYSTCTFNRHENEENVEWLAAEYGAEIVDLGLPTVAGELSDAGCSSDSNGGFAGIDHSDVGYRFWPHKVLGEGFFAAAVRKPDGRKSAPKQRHAPLVDAPREVVKELGQWVSQPGQMRFAQAGDNFYGYYNAAYADVKRLAGALAVLYSGVRMGSIFKGKLRPEHPLALFHDVAEGDSAGGVVVGGDLPFSRAALPEAELLTYLRKGEMAAEGLAEGWNLITAPGGHPVGWAKRIGTRVNNLYPKEQRILTL